jgi:hypothetical protein
LNRADEGARGLHDDLVCRRPSLGKQQRESGGQENGVRDGEQLTRRRFMRERWLIGPGIARPNGAAGRLELTEHGADLAAASSDLRYL